MTHTHDTHNTPKVVNFPYTPASKTNIMDTFKKHGFVPPSTIAGYFETKRKEIEESIQGE
jgi:hypothetical protein